VITFSAASLFPLFFIVARLRSREGLSAEEVSQRKANKLAKKYLSESKSQLNDSKAFYLALEKALHNYLKAKLRITTSELSKEKIEALLNKKGAKETDITSFLTLLKNCEMARYSPISESEINEDYNQAKNTLAQLDKNL
jgi:hypothetical protein